MSVPFLAEIKLISFNFAPKGWAMCNGQFLPINQNQALFSLLGTTYGGDGRVNFQLPDLRGRVPVHFGNGFTLGDRAGTEAVTVTIQELPQHLHFLNATQNAGTVAIPANDKVLAKSLPAEAYHAPTNLTSFHPSSVQSVGGSQAHTNMQPYLVLNFIIALQGIFPSQT